MKDAIRQGCPPWETLEALHENRLAAAQADTARQHLDACPSCRTDFAMLQEFTAATPGPAERADVDRIAARLKQARSPKKQSGWLGWRIPKWGLAAATLVLLAAIGLQWRGMRNPDLAGFDPSQTLRSSEVIEITPRGDFFVVPTNFVWNPIANAVSYQVVASEVDGTELWRGLTGQPSLTPPLPLLALLLPSKTVVIRVTALDRSGAPLARSEATRIRLVKR